MKKRVNKKTGYILLGIVAVLTLSIFLIASYLEKRQTITKYYMNEQDQTYFFRRGNTAFLINPDNFIVGFIQGPDDEFDIHSYEYIKTQRVLPVSILNHISEDEYKVLAAQDVVHVQMTKSDSGYAMIVNGESVGRCQKAEKDAWFSSLLLRNNQKDQQGLVKSFDDAMMND